MRKYLLLLLIPALLCPVSASAAEGPKYIVLTFEDSPSGQDTRQLLDALREREIRATFFLSGSQLARQPGLAEQIAAQGHEIGIQGYTHRDFSPLSRRDIAREISDTRALLPDCRVVFLRPPGGRCSDGVRQVAKALGLSILSWSQNPDGWRVPEGVRDGDVILFRNLSGSSLTAALYTIDLLENQGFTFVTVSELAQLREVRLKPGTVYHSFPPKD